MIKKRKRKPLTSEQKDKVHCNSLRWREREVTKKTIDKLYDHLEVLPNSELEIIFLSNDNEYFKKILKIRDLAGGATH